MSTDWIKMRVDLRTHPKVVRMASALKADKLRIIGGLHAVWSIFDAHAIDGLLEGYDFREIDDQLGWKGFAAAMHRIDWLVESDEGLSAPRFDEHNGQSAKRRAMETERKRQEREAEKAAADAAKAATEAGHVSASDADKSVTREEKRRDKDTEAIASVVPRASRKCPKGWLPEAPEAWVAEHCPGLDWQRETDKFRDHTFKTARTDWSGTWKNWMRKAFDDRAPAQQTKTSFTRDREAQGAAWMGTAAPRASAEIIDMEEVNGTRLAVG